MSGAARRARGNGCIAGELPLGHLRRAAIPAAEALDLGERPVRLVDGEAAGRAVEPVDVLGDQEREESTALELGERQVTRVRPGGAQ